MTSPALSPDEILGRLREHATADLTDLVEHRRGCCRYCYGIAHRYQETPAEREERWESYSKRLAASEHNPNLIPGDWSALGGVGFDKRRAPHENCPECFGEGVSEVYVVDTRDVAPETRRAIAVLKQSKYGVEVQMRDAGAALTTLARNAGLLRDNLAVSGDLTVNIRRFSAGD